MAYKIEFSPRADRQFRNLPQKAQARLKPRIDALTNNPRPRGVEKLQGEDNFYRIRMGDDRIIYQVQDKALLILVVKIGHRSDVYR